MTIRQFRVTLSPACTGDVVGDYTPVEALQAARDAFEGCYDGRCIPVVRLCVAGPNGEWIRFDDVTPDENQQGRTELAALDAETAVSVCDQAARIANLIQPFHTGLDHFGRHVYFRTRDAANEWRDACGWDYVLETTPGRIWRATQKPA